MPAPEAIDWLRYLLSVGLVLGLLGLTLWGLRRSAGASLRRPGSGDRIEVVDRFRVSPRQQLLWVRAGGEDMLLAVSPQEIRLVSALQAVPPVSPEAGQSHE